MRSATTYTPHVSQSGPAPNNAVPVGLAFLVSTYSPYRDFDPPAAASSTSPMRSRGKFGRTNLAMEFSSDESHILVIYTGGTIGMLIGSDGYSPEPYFLTKFLRSQARFHDPLQDSLFSNAGSSSTYREWSNTNNDRGPPSVRDTTVADLTQHTLPVRSTRKVGRDKASQSAGCATISENVYECHLPSLVTPRSSGGQGGKRIRYAILEVCLVLGRH